MPDVEMVDIDDNCNKPPNSEINQINKNTNTNIKKTDNQSVVANDTEMDSDRDNEYLVNGEEISYNLTKFFNELPKKNRYELTNSGDNIKVKDDNNQIDEPMEEDNSRSEATFTFKITDVTNFFNSKDNRLSEPCYVRNLPWKIMAMPRFSADRQTKSLGFFLQCNAESESLSWSCNAAAELRLINQIPGQSDMTRSIDHYFIPKENDWGFTQFISYHDIMDPAKGFCKDDTIILQVYVKADVPHGIQWNSKKYTGCVGLKNQGATCYMNSLLQTLFFTNKLRKAVYLMPTESDDSSKSVALALQRVFYELQFSDKPVGTKKLTKSFGWETLDSFMQHDVQELCRVLLDNIESKMKNTCVAGTIPKLFEGKMISFIRCKHVDFHSTRTEPFYDIQLNIKGKQNIYASFDEYISVETLNGENKYDAGEYGLQEAEKGIIFESFPPVLHLHLLRFQYDPLTDNNVKINDRFEFYETIELGKYLKSNNNVGEDSYKQPYSSFVSDYQNSNNNNNSNKQNDQSTTYILHAVLVHSGDNHGGHYVVFINPKGDGNWCKFDDDVVSVCSKTEAISNNFGSSDDEASKHCTNAYMLVYIRQDSDVLEPVTEESIPSELVERLKEEKRQETLRRKERTDSHLYLTLTALTECSFMGHRGNDLFDLDKAISQTFKVQRTLNYQQTLNSIGAELNYPPEGIRLWQIIRRDNETYRPSALEFTDDKNRSIEDILERSSNVNSLIICFLELVRPSAPIKRLPDYNLNSGIILLFFKYYDPINEFITYCGYDYIDENSKFSALVPILNEKVGLPPNTPLILYEEVRSDCCNRVIDQTKTLKQSLEDLMNGDIICFQKDDISTYSKSVKLPTVIDYFRDLNNRIEVVLCDKNIPNDTGFVLELSKDMNYDELSKAVAQRLNTEPDLIQFYRIQSNYRNEPSQPIKCNFEGTLKDLFPNSPKPRITRKLFYQLLTIKINELEFKKQFKCVWVNSKLKEERELLLYPNKSGTVADLLDEAKKHLCENVYNSSILSPDGSGKLRLLEITSNRIIQILKEDVLVECLNTTTSKSYRVEEIPKDELDLEPNEFLMPVAHFHKETIHTFGTPFLLKIKQKELLSQIKARIQKKLDVSDKEFEKYKFALVTGSRAQYFNDTTDYPISKEEFQMHVTSNNAQGMQNRPWLGLEHMNKAPKRSRYNYLEKAIKIHN